MVNAKNNRVLLSHDYWLIVVPWKFDVVKPKICFKNIKFPLGQLSPNKSLSETFYNNCLLFNCGLPGSFKMV